MGIGPGSPEDRTIRATEVIRNCDVVVGYTPYVESLRDIIGRQHTVTSGMRAEVGRCREALKLARNGQTVALVSSGDAGVYGMAGLAMEMTAAESLNVELEVVPGVTAASTAAARLGAPLMLDFAVISLSDLLVPWNEIKMRISAIAPLDMVLCLYNPKSKKRISQIEETASILRAHRAPETPVGIGRNLGKEDERVTLTQLSDFLKGEIDMKSIIIVGARSTRCLGPYMVTARGYAL